MFKRLARIKKLLGKLVMAGLVMVSLVGIGIINQNVDVVADQSSVRNYFTLSDCSIQLGLLPISQSTEVGPCTQSRVSSSTFIAGGESASVFYNCRQVAGQDFTQNYAAINQVECAKKSDSQFCFSLSARPLTADNVFQVGARDIITNEIAQSNPPVFEKCKSDAAGLCSFYWENPRDGGDKVKRYCTEKLGYTERPSSNSDGNVNRCTIPNAATDAEIIRLKTASPDNIWEDSKWCRTTNGGLFQCTIDATTLVGSSCLSINAVARRDNAPAVEPPAEAPAPSNDAGFFGILFNILAYVVLIIIYIFGWMASVILWFLGFIFLTFLQINPADSTFYQVALPGWQIIVGVANLVVLSTFLFVGFAYILNIKAWKKPISEFVLGIAVFTILLNLTLPVTAVAINVFQGVGDLMILTATGSSGNDGKSKLIAGFVSGINSASYIRCGSKDGKASTEPSCRPPDTSNPVGAAGVAALDFGAGIAKAEDALVGSDTTGEGPGTIFTGKVSSRPVRAILGELIFLVICLAAIQAMFKAGWATVFRVIGLWLLMVVSPLALALYFSPLKELQKYGTMWVDKFWRSLLFYPIFVLGLVLITRVSFEFGKALTSNNGLIVNSLDVQANATSEILSAVVSISLVAIVSIVLLNLLVEFMDKTFGGLAKALLEGASKVLGATKTLASFGGSAVRGASGLILGGGSKFLKGAGVKINQSADKIKGNNVVSRFAKRQIQVVSRIVGASGDILGAGNKVGGGIGNFVEFAPQAAEFLAQAPKNIYDNFDNSSKGRAAAFKSRAQGLTEIAARTAGVGNFYDLEQEGGGLNQIAPNQTGADVRKNLNDILSLNKSRAEQEGAKASKRTKTTLNQKQVRQLFNKLAAKATDANGVVNLDNLDEKERGSYINLMKQAVNDSFAAQTIFQNPAGKTLARELFNSLDSETQAGLSKVNPSIIKDKQARETYLDSLNSTKDIESVDINLLDEDDLRYWLTVNTDPKLKAKVRQSRKDFSVGGQQQAKTILEKSDKFKLSSASQARVDSASNQLIPKKLSTNTAALSRISTIFGAPGFTDLPKDEQEKQIKEIIEEETARSLGLNKESFFQDSTGKKRELSERLDNIADSSGAELQKYVDSSTGTDLLKSLGIKKSDLETDTSGQLTGKGQAATEFKSLFARAFVELQDDNNIGQKAAEMSLYGAAYSKADAVISESTSFQKKLTQELKKQGTLGKTEIFDNLLKDDKILKELSLEKARAGLLKALENKESNSTTESMGLTKEFIGNIDDGVRKKIKSDFNKLISSGATDVEIDDFINTNLNGTASGFNKVRKDFLKTSQDTIRNAENMSEAVLKEAQEVDGNINVIIKDASSDLNKIEENASSRFEE